VEQGRGFGGGVRHAAGLGRGPAGHRGGRRPAPVRERRAWVAQAAIQNKGWEVTDKWGRATQSWASQFDLIWIQIQTNSIVIQIISNFDPSKKGLSSSIFLK
jgi:hypothetical protein